MKTEDIRDYFSRHFLGKVKVHQLPYDIPPPQIFDCRRAVDAHPVRTHLKVGGAVMYALSVPASSVRRFRFSEQFMKVSGAKIARYAQKETKAHGPALLKKAQVHADRKRMEILPQERTNRLQWQTLRPAREGTMVLLGWFGPIIEEAVVNLKLNRQQGTLLIWYNPQSRRYNAKGLYLYRRLEVNGNLEWRWV